MRKVNMRGPREKPEDWGIGQLRVLRRVNKYEFAVELEVMREGRKSSDGCNGRFLPG